VIVRASASNLPILAVGTARPGRSRAASPSHRQRSQMFVPLGSEIIGRRAPECAGGCRCGFGLCRVPPQNPRVKLRGRLAPTHHLGNHHYHPCEVVGARSSGPSPYSLATGNLVGVDPMLPTDDSDCSFFLSNLSPLLRVTHVSGTFCYYVSSRSTAEPASAGEEAVELAFHEHR